MVQMTSLVLMLIRKRPMVVPTTNICGSKKPGTTKYQTRREEEKMTEKKVVLVGDMGKSMKSKTSQP